MGLPFLLVRSGADVVPVLAGLDAGGALVGYDIAGERVLEYEPGDVAGAVSIDPAAVFWGLELARSRGAMPLAAERTEPHSGPHRGPPGSQRGTTRYAMPRVPEAPSGLEEVIAIFLLSIEGDDDSTPDMYFQDPRVARIADAIKTLNIRTDVGEHSILGSGSFGTAVALSDTKILKLTSDTSEVQAGAVLIGRRLEHVARIDGAWFIADAYVSGIVGWDEKEEDYVRAKTRVGLLIAERVKPVGRSSAAARLNKVVNEFKVDNKVYPGDLHKMGARKARSHLEWASLELARTLENARGLDDLGEGVAAGIRELHELGVYAVDVHPGNVGERDDGTIVIFDIGSSSSPKTPKAPVVGLTGIPIAPPGVIVQELGAAPRAPAGAAEAGRYAPRGYRFTPLEGYAVTGYPEVRGQLLKHRAGAPSLETIRLSALFAGSTILVGIEQAEKSFACIADLFKARGRTFPTLEEIRECIVSIGLHKMRGKMYEEIGAWAPSVRAAIAGGLMDNELRRHLMLKTELPTGLSLAKVSFTLALLGHDCICLDARILNRMFGPRASDVAKGWSHGGELAIKRYEAAEEAFLKGNPFYRPGDPIGRARAQWMSWESVGGAAATHSVWLDVVK